MGILRYMQGSSGFLTVCGSVDFGLWMLWAMQGNSHVENSFLPRNH